MAQIDCICPPKADGEPRHPSGDTVTLRERLGFRGLSTARNVVLQERSERGANAPGIAAGVTEAYLVYGIASWTLVDDKGKAVEPTRDAILDLLDAHPDIAIAIGDEADALYSPALYESLEPLLAAESISSQPTPTDGPTSPQTSTSVPKRRKHSKRSSTSITRTDGIVTISPSLDGDSNSLPNSKSAR